MRLVRREERARWRELMRQHHYLGFDSIIGESLWYVARVGNEWVALLGWGSAALKCGVRDQWIGWDRARDSSRPNIESAREEVMDFRSDNVAGAAPQILEAVIAAEKQVIAATQAARAEGIQGLGKLASDQEATRKKAEG